MPDAGTHRLRRGARGSERLVIPTCVGCGAMGVFGSCDRACREERLDLVGADAFDELVAQRARSRSAADSFRAVVEKLTCAEPPEEKLEMEYRRLQNSARRALTSHPEAPPDRPAGDESVRAATAWWCPDCGGLEAPQPCLGICVWRPVEWVTKQRWQQGCDELALELEAEAALRRILRQLAFVTPRDGRWKAGWQALSAGARPTLERVSRPAPEPTR